MPGFSLPFPRPGTQSLRKHLPPPLYRTGPFRPAPSQAIAGPITRPKVSMVFTPRETNPPTRSPIKIPDQWGIWNRGVENRVASKPSDAGIGQRCRVPGSGYLPFLILHTPCARFSKTGTRYRVPGLRSRVPGTWDPIPGTGFAPRAEHRAPKTELGPWKTRTPGLHPASIS